MHIKTLSLRKLALVSAVALIAAGAASAQAQTADLGVTATVTQNCSISALPLAFDTYNPVTAAAVTGEGTVTVACTSGGSASIGLGAGLGAVGATRSMSSGDNLLNYSLHSNEGRTTDWDDDTNRVAITGTGIDVPYTVYGTILADQTTAPAGDYADTVVADVSF